MPPRRVPNFFQELIELAQEQRTRGLLGLVNLGGASGAAGGTGSPPGGFLGKLPQSRVAYDTTEAATATGGSTLVDNLNHIRARLATLETSGVGGLATIPDEVYERIWWGW